jgi:predicted RNA-binding Zn-ribbon protein involved in translation (DUF1610 family)
MDVWGNWRLNFCRWDKSMNDFFKCECPHCGQNIEYPSEGAGQTVPCPTCGKSVVLIQAKQPHPDEVQREKEWDEWIILNEQLKERQIQSGITPSQEVLPTNQPQDNEEVQRKKEWDEWIALNRRLYERQIQSGITPSQEALPQNVSFQENVPEAPKQPRQNYEMFCPVCDGNIEVPIAAVGTKHACPNCQSEIVPVFSRKRPRKEIKTRLGNLTEVTIRKRTQTGDTPLHRAAKIGRICDIPKHLLQIELFMARNNSFARETPLHVAARYGQLDKIPKEFLTKETLTASTEYERKESKTGPTPPRTETPLHTAARYGHADQIPKEFLTPEFLSIEASGYRLTVLHQLAYAKRLDLIPDIYANSEMWNLKDSQGRTPREALESVIQREAYVTGVRAEPATEKQKEKLRYFGYAFDENISKGQASDALDKCVRDFPEVNQAYYNRPATEEQLAQLPPRFKAERAELLSYGHAKDLILERELEKQNKNDEKLDRELLIGYIANYEDFYPSLTPTRIKKAAKALDESAPGWHEKKGCEKVLLEKVAALNPELAAKEDWMERLTYL